MPLSITARVADPSAVRCPFLAVALPSGTKAVPKDLHALDRLFGGQIGTALRNRNFRGGRDGTLALTQAGRRGPARVVLVGMGSADRRQALRRAAAVAARAAHRSGDGELVLFAGALD